MKNVITFLLAFLFGSLQAQQSVIRGTVKDAFTREGLPRANAVLVLPNGSTQGTITDERGRFRFEGLAPDRYTLQISFIGYKPYQSQQVLHAGKETVLEVALQESADMLDEVQVVAEKDKFRANNELVVLSAKSFNAEDTRRFAGSLNDPSRMAANFAGVSGANDARNDIVIRGNTPSGLLFRLEGLDIPNPNHFGAMGTTGGPVSILNNNVLGSSDFITGAFPAGYGNATSGVFDLSLRNGNNEKREYTGQIGFNGVELGAEGPLSGGRGSYLINYRYSTLAVFNALGIEVGTGAAVPQYQDISFKLNHQLGKYGNINLFGIGGISYIELLSSENDENNLFSQTGRNIYSGSEMGVLGAKHQVHLGNQWLSEFTTGITANRTKNRVDSLDIFGENPAPFYGEDMTEQRWVNHWRVKKRFNRKQYLTTGALYIRQGFDYQDSVYRSDRFVQLRTNDGITHQFQAYAQYQYHFSDKLMLSAGLHSNYLEINGSFSIEPRASMSWEFTNAQFIKAGYGRHSQSPFLFNLFYRSSFAPEGSPFTNRDLGFSLADHFVLGYENRKIKNWSFKAEAYLQELSNIAVEQRPSSFSMLNFGADFGVPAVDSLVNNGTGRNYGIELTVERSFSKGFYLLHTLSLFDASYVASDGIRRNSAFNNQFVANILGGKEFKINNKTTLAFDLRSSYAGGRYYTPIDLDASILAKEAVYDENNAFSEKFPNYFRTDFRITVRLNGKKVMQEWFLDLQNLTNQQNPFMQQYSPSKEEVVFTYQLGLFPMVFYRILF